MNKDLRISFKVPIYDFNFTTIVTEDFDKWSKRYPSPSPMYPSGPEMPDEAFCCALEGKSVVIVIRPTTTLATIAHEIGHASRHIMNYIGFKIHSDNDEPLAYLEGYLTQKVHDKLKCLTKPKSKRKIHPRRKRR